jgi:hypothetical protein
MLVKVKINAAFLLTGAGAGSSSGTTGTGGTGSGTTGSATQAPNQANTQPPAAHTGNPITPGSSSTGGKQI